MTDDIDAFIGELVDGPMTGLPHVSIAFPGQSPIPTTVVRITRRREVGVGMLYRIDCVITDDQQTRGYSRALDAGLTPATWEDIAEGRTDPTATRTTILED